MREVSSVPLLFGPAERRLAGVLHPTAQPPRAAVLICPPLLHEHARSYRFFAGVADELARSGVICLRFDYFGSGDSAGATDAFHPAQVGEDIALATEVLRNHAPHAPLVLMGIRASALFALAHARQVGTHATWLWQPVIDPSVYLRELDALDALERTSRLRYPFARSGPAALPSEIVGFACCPSFREELRAVPAATANAPRVSVIDVAAESVATFAGGTHVALPEAVAGWTGEVELQGLLPVRAVRNQIELLAASVGGA